MAIGSRLHVDDAYTWLVASQPNAHAFLHQLAATENTPPLGTPRQAAGAQTADRAVPAHAGEVISSPCAGG